jgi:hypothetical protein
MATANNSVRGVDEVVAKENRAEQSIRLCEQGLDAARGPAALPDQMAQPQPAQRHH